MTVALSIIDTVAWIATVTGLILLLRPNRMPPAARLVLAVLLGLNLLQHTSTLLEQAAISTRLGAVEGFLKLLLPFLWGSFLHNWFQHTVTQDFASSAQILNAERQFISTVMRATPTAIITCNRRGQVIFANPHAEQILGCTLGEMQQHGCTTTDWDVTGESAWPLPDANQPLWRILAAGEPIFGLRHRVPAAAEAAGSKDRLLSINGVPIRGADGQISEVVLTISDITEETHTQQRTLRLNALLRALRSVNQLIAREKDAGRLLAGACAHLVSTQGYHTARIFTPDAQGTLHPQTGAPPESTEFHSDRLLQQVWQTGQADWVTESEPVRGTGAAATARYQRVGAARIQHHNRVYGVLGVEVPGTLRLVDEETGLLEEVAADIGFALHNLEQEDALQHALAAQTDLLDRLRALVAAGNDLSRTTSTDDLCRRAVELGIASLGFDRLGIWFRTEAPSQVEGSYGTDEQGRVRDERGVRLTWDDQMRQRIESGYRLPLHIPSDTLRDHLSHAVGTGDRAMASIWDGKHHLGHISADNLLSGRLVSEQDAEVLSLYAATFGHLYGRLRTEQAAHDRDAIYRTIFQNTGTAMAIIEVDGTLSLVNDETVRMSGYTREEIENRMHVTDFIVGTDPLSLAAYQAWTTGSDLSEARSTSEMQVHNRSGTSRSVLVAAARIPGTARTVVSLLDITPQKEAAAAHRRRAVQQTALNAIIAASTQTSDLEHLMSTALDQTLHALEVDRGILWLSNQSLARGLPAHVLPPNHGEVWLGDHLDIPVAIDNIEQLEPLSGAEPPLYRMGPMARELNIHALLTVPVYFDPDRTHSTRVGKLALISDIPRQWTEEEIALVSAVGQQLGTAAERLRLLAQVQAQAERLQHVIDTVPEGVLLLDHLHHVVLANLSARSLLRTVIPTDAGIQVSRVGNRTIEALLAPPPRGSWHETEAVGRIFEVIARPVIPHADPEGWVLVLRDVTEARQIDEHRQQQDRLAAVGRLAAGIAHDFNNIMAVILLYAQMGNRVPAMPETGRQHLETIIQQAHRASNLITQILDFSRRSALERRPMNLLIFLKEICRLLEHTLPETITLHFDYEAGSHRVSADPTRMQQVLMNLAINARDAMPTGGELRLHLDTITVAGGEPPVPDMPAGNWVRLTVRDTGAGMPAELQAHLFEPFFTTKEPGSGTGLGLAQVHGILMQHDGMIRVDSGPGQGTTFTLYLPALDTPPESGFDIAERDTAPLATGQRQLVLVVEDNTQTREAIAEALRSLDYAVIEARDGREALTLLQTSAEPIALVVSDLVMPEMGGMALLEAVADLGMTVPIVIISGHLESVEHRQFKAGQRLITWLPKPVSIEQLAETISAAINGEGSAAAATD